MARLSDKDLENLRQRIDTAKRFRDKRYKPLCDKAWRYWRGKHLDPETGDSREPLTLNYFWPILETKLKSIGFNYPDFVVQPQTRDAVPFSRISLHALRYEWDHSRVQPEVLLALQDRVVGGIGIVYVGWEVELEETDGSITTQEGQRAPIEGEQDSTPDENQPAPIPARKVVKDQVLVKYVNPLLFFVDPSCGPDLQKARYCGFSEYVPLEDVKADKRYGNKRDLKGTTKPIEGYLSSELRKLEDVDRPADSKFVLLHHIFEKKTRTHTVIADETGKAIFQEKFPWAHGEYPFEVIAGARSPRDFWAIPDCLYYEHPVLEVEQARARSAEFLRKAVPKVAIVGEQLSPYQRKQLQDGSVYGALELRPGQDLRPLIMPQQQFEIQQTYNAALQDIQTISGLDQYSIGVAPTKRLTTTEAQTIAAAGGPRELADRQDFENFCAAVAHKILKLLMQYSARTRTLPIYDRDQNVIDFEDYSGREIRGEFRVKVHVGSTTAPNNADTIQAIAFLLQSIGPIVQFIPVADQAGINLRPLIQECIKSIPGIKSVEEIFQPPAQPPALPGGPPQGGAALPPTTEAGLETNPTGAEGLPPAGPGDINQLLALLQQMGQVG